ncbi:hypothetical protein J2X06_001250 [Lysobacter niastensis]|uniref:Uncharacterized protein n=1 Tax=Lysobacter niastensis TaxID=380629 RepID=A0ABU1W8Y4_9GAMM|nr:hypothetical protein [Lysobacter niastensis]MDR7134066.1 hypothetical protein [Lysobacter niastensis]
MEFSREVKVELNCLRIRSEHGLIRWAESAFQLPPARLPYTEYTADFVCGCIAGHAADTRTFFIVNLKHAWLASYTVRKLLFGPDGWRSRLGYRLMHDDGIAVHFGT